ncbi:MAG: sigma-70 family RNA polymerase sigma factor [Candidatus Omnitrophica bacterium]|nr:sigma-70 family RNA polymerase sigma factor [Candidatus Omnitrophota bacterium]
MNAIKAYLERIKDLPVLTKEEEVELIEKAKQGDRPARRRLINCNLKLVVNIAKHYTHLTLSLMDLIAEGNIGLMRAIDKFDTTRGFRFSTYAAWWIRQAITRSIIDQGKTIRVPVYASEFISKYKKAQEALRQKLNREPNRKEIAKQLKVSEDKVAEIELWIQKKSSLEAPVGKDGASEFGDFIVSDANSGTDKAVNKIFRREKIEHLFDALSKREKRILDLRFGISDGTSHTLAEISEELDISRERVRQIEKEALGKLKKYSEQEKKRRVE